MITRKDYNEFAEWIANKNLSDEVINGLMEFFERNNPRFDRERFKNYINKLKKNIEYA